MIDLIKYPVINFKAYRALVLNNQYMFNVDLRLTKPQIKQLIEEYFKVNVISVNTHRPPRKKRLYIQNSPGFKKRYKRVIITLKKTQEIPYIKSLMASNLAAAMQRVQSAQTSNSNPTNSES
uniref:Large ribosomal subunit protein uL23c n=1 Tax=Uronema confervicola TaxID=764120 RepID=A0A6H1U5Q7_9CHLO|nr:ribosomal protein L23 [Uronema confervicola]QIZ74184.1 ribosomal protein L23 [Uronema confervicola]